MIARETGVGLGTVSRALRGLAGVTPETQARILAAAGRLGYVRDPQLAHAFSFARRAEKPVYRETLAFLAAERESGYVNHPWLEQVCEGARSRAADLGYTVRCFSTPRLARAQRALSRQLRAQGIRGVAISAVIEWVPFELDMAWEHFAAVELGHSLWSPSLMRVERDLADDFARMFSEIQRRGYRRIGLAMNRDDEVRRRWSVLASYLLFRHRNEGLAGLAGLRPLEDVFPYTRRDLLRWIRRERPDVIVVNGSEPLDWLREEGWRVPGDVAVCRIDCIPGRPETGLAADYRQMGRAGVNLLSNALEHGELGLPERPGVLSIPNRWSEGSTLPADVR
jgi:LacI family transcriptional regulator